MKPPTVQKFAKAPELNNHGAAKVTDVPGAMPPLNVAKVPDIALLWTVFAPQETTLVAVRRLLESKVAVPWKPMVPVIGVALAVYERATATTAATASVMIFFIVSWY